LPSIIEFIHRLGAAAVTVLVAAVVFLAWRHHRQDRWVLMPALLAPVILCGQILLGAVTVKFELPPAVVGSHLGVALLLVADLTAVTLGVHPAWGMPPRRGSGTARLSPLVGVVLVSLFVLLFLGATVVGTGSSLACPDWPLCYGALLPFTLGPQVAVQFLHRLSALLTFLLAILLFRETAGMYGQWPQPFFLAGTALALLVVQIVIGAGMVLFRLPLEWQALHVLLATTIWTLLAALEVMRLRWNPLVSIPEGAEA
jgi:cytochrome c oxidase assembly protein subunit 15